MKIAIIGTGISGNAAAWLLNKAGHDITVFEQDSRIGGHSNTVSSQGHPDIDTGFIVYNEWTYPNLITLFEHLKVETEKTDMSFSVSMNDGNLEYSSDALFAQKSNFLRPSFHKMWLDILRFYKSAPDILNHDYQGTLNNYLQQKKYSNAFINNHILPMAAAIWSTDSGSVGDFPAKSFVQFFVNHGLFKLKNRPQWWTVKGGSKNYVEKLTADLKDKIRTGNKVQLIERFDDFVSVDGEKFDHAVLACHSDQSLEILGDASNEETQTLKSFPYAPNIAYLHTDETLMPKRKSAWASWNYMGSVQNSGSVYVSYWMNKLQPSIGNAQNYFVTLNPQKPPQEDKILSVQNYDHPQFSLNALEGWKNICKIQGINRTWFCGAWCGYGFHEDGLSSGLAVAEALGGMKRPWDARDKSPAGAHCTPTQSNIKQAA